MKAHFASIAALISAVLATIVLYYYSPEQLEIYGSQFHRGRILRSLIDVGWDGAPLDPTQPLARFYIHFFEADQRLYPCRDTDCFAAAQRIVDQGGHLDVHDLKSAQSYGIPIIHDGVSYRLADSIMIIADGEGRITSIYRNVSFADLDIGIDAAMGEMRAVDKARRAFIKLRDRLHSVVSG